MPYVIFTTMFLAPAACLLVLYLLSLRKRVPKGLRLPLGPPGHLIFGNAYDFPREQEWLKVTEWGKKYGDLVHLKILNIHMIFINSANVAHDLFEKRSSIYSDRFTPPMLYDLVGADWALPMMPYGEKWLQHRKAFTEHFNRSAIAAFHDVETEQTRKFLRRLHESPDQFMKHVRHLSGAIIMEVVYGIQVLPDGDPYVQTAEKVAVAFAEAGNPGAFLVDIFPILKYVPAWMPGAGFRRKARAWRPLVTSVASAPFQAVKKGMAAGTAKHSILTLMLEDLHSQSQALRQSQDQEEVIRNVAGIAFLGGADTTVAAITSFILAMVLYPQYQFKAQDELDSKIGDRLPTLGDREDLPYVNAMSKEAIRWLPVVPLGAAHRVTQDDVYGDIFIPKGSIMFGNSWAMLHDEKLFGPETDKFNPERFLSPGVKDPTFAFGFGRRICPGRFMAEDSIFIAIASILKIFDISHARDSHGKEIVVKAAQTSGCLSHPEPFQCSIQLRPSAESLLASCSDQN